MGLRAAANCGAEPWSASRAWGYAQRPIARRSRALEREPDMGLRAAANAGRSRALEREPRIGQRAAADAISSKLATKIRRNA